MCMVYKGCVVLCLDFVRLKSMLPLNRLEYVILTIPVWHIASIYSRFETKLIVPVSWLFGFVLKCSSLHLHNLSVKWPKVWCDIFELVYVISLLLLPLQVVQEKKSLLFIFRSSINFVFWTDNDWHIRQMIKEPCFHPLCELCILFTSVPQ